MTSKQSSKQYGFWTAISMIIGIVIGSGIFFKSDDILNATGGDVKKGILVFFIGAFGIIFGSLTLTELANRTDKSGGIVAYFEAFVSPKMASGFGWFQTFVYFPTLIAVLAWVAGIYIAMLLGLSNSLEQQWIIGLFCLLFFFITNRLSTRYSGYFQTIAMVIKLIPLILIAVIGVFWKGPQPVLEASQAVTPMGSVGWSWLAALVPMAYSFDGWVVVTSIGNEVRNPKKNLTLALILGPLIVLGVYVAFFYGMTRLLGPAYIIATRDAALNQVGSMLLGTHGSQILLIFIIISVLGVINGMTLGMIRMPQALAIKKMIHLSDGDGGKQAMETLSLKSWQLSFLVTLGWYCIHYMSQRLNLLDGGDISEIAVVFSYACYIILYLRVINMKKKHEIEGIFKGVICPIFAIIGASIIFIGGFICHFMYVSLFVGLCIMVFALGVLYYYRTN